jgi:hypothetical protein
VKAVAYPHRFTVRCTKVEHRLLVERVKASGLSVSRFLIETGLRSTDPAAAKDRARLERLLFQLHKIGVNLNQLTRRLNTGIPVSADALEAALQATAAAASALIRSDE